jgi:hypothetical protein
MPIFFSKNCNLFSNGILTEICCFYNQKITDQNINMKQNNIFAIIKNIKKEINAQLEFVFNTVLNPADFDE